VRPWAVLPALLRRGRNRQSRAFQDDREAAGFSVEVDVDQAVITRGPDRWVRHPSYTGLLLIALGFGLGFGNWLSLVICGVIPPLRLLPRTAVEESEMIRVLGERYRSYQRATHRLVPGLW
jgi:protein-S-isoprenylcysteine O-methyltransferase Ste14